MRVEGRVAPGFLPEGADAGEVELQQHGGEDDPGKPLEDPVNHSAHPKRSSLDDGF
jgi:hypothetical protein